MQHSFQRGQTASAIFDHEIRERDQDFGEENHRQHHSPHAVQLEPCKREEHERIQKFTRSMQARLEGGGTFAGQPLRDLVMPEVVEPAEQRLCRDECEEQNHDCVLAA